MTRRHSVLLTSFVVVGCLTLVPSAGPSAHNGRDGLVHGSEERLRTT
jgi:hypothetical protein